MKIFMRGASLALLVGLGNAGCSSLVDDLNNDPNSFTDITLELALNQAQLNQASLVGGFPAHVATMWTDQFKGTDRQYLSYDQYDITAADFDDEWEDIYQRGVVQAQLAKQIAQEQGVPALQGVASILEGYYFGEAASMFGDVPFSQANMIEQFPSPAFDPQSDVLRGAVALIDAGIALVGDLTLAETSMNNNIYVSEATWAQYGNALKARYLLGLMDYDGAFAAAQAANMTMDSEDVAIESRTADFSENLYWQFEFEQRNGYLSVGDLERGFSYLQQLLSDTSAVSRMAPGTNDEARYDFFVQPGDSTDSYVRYNITDGFAAQTAPLTIISVAEVQLILAEAALLKSNPDRAAALAGLNAAREYWDMKLGTDNYDDLDDADVGDDVALRRAILEEKYLSVIGLPTFYDMNRTRNLLGIPSEIGRPIARRFLYPSTESSSNDNFPGVISYDVALPLYR